MTWWQETGVWLFGHIKTILAGVGFTGGGVGMLKYLKHVPAPKKDSLWLGSVFDTVQDVVSNNERIGQRRDADSVFATETKAGGKTATAQIVTEAKPTPEVITGKVLEEKKETTL